MAALTDLYIKADVLQTILDTVKAKGDKGISITISISDEANQYGQNVSSYVSQTKEQREAKANRFYIGNGKVFWTDGRISKVEQQQQQQPQANDSGDSLPF